MTKTKQIHMEDYMGINGNMVTYMEAHEPQGVLKLKNT